MDVSAYAQLEQQMLMMSRYMFWYAVTMWLMVFTVMMLLVSMHGTTNTISDQVTDKRWLK